MKKFACGAIGLLSLFALASCNTNSINDNNNNTSGDVDYEFETPEIEGEVIEVTKPEPESTVKIERGNFKTMVHKDVDDAFYACPSVGNPKVLVIPINFDNTKATDANLTMINTAFNGDEQSTGWESLKSFYKKSSNNLLNFDITVLNEWFTPSHDKSYYEDSESDNIDTLFSDAITYFDSKIDFSSYDSDNDGIVDGVHFVYNCSTDYNGDTNFWAWTNDYPFDTKYDGKEIGKFVFSGIDFFTEESDLYDTSDILVDAHTLIHETGHMLGLEDYYDYDSTKGSKEGLYGPSMMDSNIGDFSPLDKILFGWIEPLVITGSGAFDYDLSKFALTNDCIILADHELTSVYDEFFILEYYTEDGLFAHDIPIDRANKNTPCKGIRLYHVNATLNLDSEGNQVANDETYFGVVFKCDNTWTSKPFIKVVTRKAINSNDYLSENELYVADGKTFGVDYNKNYKLDNGKSLFFTFKVNSLGDKASLSFMLK